VVVNRTFFDEDVFGDLVESNKETRLVTAPTATYVGDNVLYGYYGPVNGSRYYLSASPSIPLIDKSLQYVTYSGDYRKYWSLTPGYQLAFRSAGVRSQGRDAQVFEVGGYSTIRGYRDFDLRGTSVGFTNLEVRFPFINALGVVGPLPIGFFNLRGAVFADVGAVWSDDDQLRLFDRTDEGKRRMRDLKSSVGVGARSSLGFLLLKLDVAWAYDLRDWKRPRYHFSLGPEF
jgi:outer membrane protein assembly factor BamA